MIKSLWFFIITYVSIPTNPLNLLQNDNYLYCKKPTVAENICPIKQRSLSMEAIHRMLHKKEIAMRPAVINKVLLTLKCSKQYHTEHNNILTVIDYSLPSNKKRLWVFDLQSNTLLFHTYVSHGIKSGTGTSTFFSNRHNSKASSIGVYKTEQAYYGRYGLALKLDGQEKNFNNNAFGRAIVMHGGWYVDENFIKKYGRPGRSWGCPAIPPQLTNDIIHTIKDDGLFIAYYPSEEWYIQSKYLNCDQFSHIPKTESLQDALVEPLENRDAILFIEKNDNDLREENEPIVVISADDYQQVFNRPAPLKRMLRRQINHKEYIALNYHEFGSIINKNAARVSSNPSSVAGEVFFVLPVVKRVRGYYATEMKIVTLGTIKSIQATENTEDSSENTPALEYIVHFEKRPSVRLKSTEQFIRWLGL